MGFQPISPTTENTLYTFENWGPAFEVTLDLKINAWSYPNNYGQILQFSNSNSGGGCCSPGQRVPGIWTEKNGNVVIVSFDSVRQLVYDFQLGTWYHLVLSKKKEQVHIFSTFLFSFEGLFILRING